MVRAAVGFRAVALGGGAGGAYLGVGLGPAGVAVLAAVGAVVLPLLAACWSPGLLVPRGWRKRWRARPWRDPETGLPGRRPRPGIGARVERAALARGRCAYCRARGPLAADHVCPFAEGGSMGLFNLMPLCRTCNGRKLDYWPGRWIPASRRWRPARGAPRILAAERVKRWSPLRWAAAWVALVA